MSDGNHAEEEIVIKPKQGQARWGSEEDEEESDYDS